MTTPAASRVARLAWLLAQVTGGLLLVGLVAAWIQIAAASATSSARLDAGTDYLVVADGGRLVRCTVGDRGVDVSSGGRGETGGVHVEPDRDLGLSCDGSVKVMDGLVGRAHFPLRHTWLPVLGGAILIVVPAVYGQGIGLGRRDAKTQE